MLTHYPFEQLFKVWLVLSLLLNKQIRAALLFAVFLWRVVLCSYHAELSLCKSNDALKHLTLRGNRFNTTFSICRVSIENHSRAISRLIAYNPNFKLFTLILRKIFAINLLNLFMNFLCAVINVSSVFIYSIELHAYVCISLYITIHGWSS